jgi:hypothetical protein
MNEEDTMETVVLWMYDREKNDFNIYPEKFNDIKGVPGNEVLPAVRKGVGKGYIWDISSNDLGGQWMLSPKGIAFAKTVKKK